MTRFPHAADPEPPRRAGAYRFLNYTEQFHGSEPRFWLGVALGSMTAGLLAPIAIDARANSTHSFQFEVRVYDVRGAPIVRVSHDDGTFRSAYDTSVSPPLLRRTYSGELRTWIGAGSQGPGGADLDRFMDEQGAEIADVMFNLSAQDVLAAIRRAAASQLPSPP